MLNRKLTSRDKLLLLILMILVVVCAYLFLVHIPVTNSITESKTSQAELLAQCQEEAAKTNTMLNMQDLLDKAKANPNQSYLANYNNITNVVAYLNGLMSSAKDYDLVFYDVESEDHIATRKIDMTFTCDGYASVKSIIGSLQECPYYCTIPGISIGVGENTSDIRSGEVTVKLTVVFYEYLEQAVKKTTDGNK